MKVKDAVRHLLEYNQEWELALSVTAEGDDLKLTEDIDEGVIDGEDVVVLFP